MKLKLFCTIFLCILIKNSSSESIQNKNSTIFCNIQNGFFHNFALYAGSDAFGWFKEHESILRKTSFEGASEFVSKFSDKDKDFVWNLIPETKLKPTQVTSAPKP